MYYWAGCNAVLIWKEIESKGILDGRSWMSMKGKFLKHIVGNLEKYKANEDKMVAADGKTGRTWRILPEAHQAD